MNKYTKGEIVNGVVTGVEKYGAFVSLDDEYTGLIHISEISKGFVRDINDFLKNGDKIKIEILEVDEFNKKIKLSIKNIDYLNKKKKMFKIKETVHGFSTLKEKLPIWIEKSLKKSENV